MIVRLTPAAIEQLRARRAWWIEHRDKAPDLFDEELEALIRRLRAQLDAERQLIKGPRGRTTWRIQMPKTRTHVYYRVDEDAELTEIVAVWNAMAGTGPRL